MKKTYMMQAGDVMKALGVSRSKAYEIISNLNQMLEKEGYWVECGKIPRPYLEQKFYGFSEEYL